MLARKAIVKAGLIKPLEAIDLPEDKAIVMYIPEKKEVEEYSDWAEEEWQRFSLRSFMNTEDESFSYQMMRHQVGNEKEEVWNAI